VTFSLGKRTAAAAAGACAAFHSGYRAARRKPLANPLFIDDNRRTMVPTTPRPVHTPSAGFTLIELMLGLTILGILLGVAGPAFLEAQRNVAISGQANDLHADLALARSEAVKRNQAVMLCASVNQTCSGLTWAQGWMVFADANGNGAWDPTEVPLKTRGPLGGATTLVSVGHLVAGGVAYVPYYPSGVSRPAGVDFVLCDARTTPNAGREIEINVTGRPSVVRVTCPMTPSL